SAGLAVSSPDAAAFHRGHTAVNDLQLMPTSELPFFCLFGLTSLTNVHIITPILRDEDFDQGAEIQEPWNRRDYFMQRTASER
ncbi:hypothetical protein, partial [Pyramidobacter piscolens]|uniref:hypothetical protein n=1 Tax=Pyramidobacter piscolens TaxID=638849 RepID=UPI003AF42829